MEVLYHKLGWIATNDQGKQCFLYSFPRKPLAFGGDFRYDEHNKTKRGGL